MNIGVALRLGQKNSKSKIGRQDHSLNRLSQKSSNLEYGRRASWNGGGVFLRKAVWRKQMALRHTGCVA